MACPVWSLALVLLLQLVVLWAIPNGKKTDPHVHFYFHKGIGESCEDHQECRSQCCVANSLSPRTFCTPQTILLRCVPWRKPLGYECRDHQECQSLCCAFAENALHTICTDRTIFMQCIPWRKPDMDFCSNHDDCASRCCTRLIEDGYNRCIPRKGLIAQCLSQSPRVSGASAASGDCEGSGQRAVTTRLHRDQVQAELSCGPSLQRCREGSALCSAVRLLTRSTDTAQPVLTCSKARSLRWSRTLLAPPGTWSFA
ncbi:PREDICTED: leucine-rich colipase-like protein 1 [Elephantulus edwardii]|uniref:leucine-rich colipase-like protein 1 n=1 Tax=Elephantulus edwardii TaxID=28737 RepID=UPI0003F0DC11|nr:PREDICTED: leucine-rich colipase-like protein 1 [Elephantulus edwardii]